METDKPQQPSDPWWFPDDPEANEIISEAVKTANTNYVKNAGQAYYEDLLVRATIALCRGRYDSPPLLQSRETGAVEPERGPKSFAAANRDPNWRCPKCGRARGEGCGLDVETVSSGCYLLGGRYIR